MKTRTPHLTGHELEIMKVVWDLGDATVRDVYERLLAHRKIAYTTVLTMMKILEQKGHLKKNEGEKAHVYRPAQPRRKVVGGMVREFLDRVFNGNVEPLMIHLLEERCLTEKELRELQRKIQKNRETP